MALLKLSVFVYVAIALYLAEDVRAFGKISCFYNSKAAERKGKKLNFEEINT